MLNLYEISKKLGLEKEAEGLLVENRSNQTRVKDFSDPRIAATQALADYFLLEQSHYPYTLDITQFFLLNEPFSKGYSLSQEVISPLIDYTVSGKTENQEYRDLLRHYAHILLNGKSQAIEEAMIRLDQQGSKASLSLFNNTFMKTPEYTPLYNGKKVVVTGSDTGIGRETALEFARRGANVTLHYPSEYFERGALSAFQLISSSRGNAACYQADFRSLGEINEFAKKAFSDGINILINNAGITLCKQLEKTTDKELTSLVNVNLLAAYMLSREAVHIMKEQGSGVIMNFSSNHAIAGKAGHSAYAMTKGGILSLSRALAMEFARDNIRVNAILPGGVITESHLRMMPEFAESGANNPLQRWNNPHDIARAICWYCSDEAKNITGQGLIIDSGMSAAITGGYDATIIPDMPFGKRFMDA